MTQPVGLEADMGASNQVPAALEVAKGKGACSVCDPGNSDGSVRFILQDNCRTVQGCVLYIANQAGYLACTGLGSSLSAHEYQKELEYQKSTFHASKLGRSERNIKCGGQTVKTRC